VGIGCHGQHDRADGAQIAQAYLLAYGPQGGCRAGDAGPQVAGPAAVDEVVVVDASLYPGRIEPRFRPSL